VAFPKRKKHKLGGWLLALSLSHSRGMFIGVSLDAKVKEETSGVCISHTEGLAIYIKKSILRQKKKKNYEKSNYISPCKNIIFNKTNLLNETKILQDIIIIIIIIIITLF
jgi:hypothetical protein